MKRIFLGAISASLLAFGASDMAFELPDLPYAHDALADLGMSKETLEYHHDLHHKAYVDNGNKLIAGHRVGRQVARRDHHRHL
jgi:superoxide dismutase